MTRTLLLGFLVGAGAFAQPAPVHQYLLRIEPVRADFALNNITEEERPAIQGHILYLQGLFAKGTMTFAGQVFDPKHFWGIIIVNASTTDEASGIMNGDPAIKSGKFRGEVIPFRTVFERAAAPAPKTN